MPFYRDDECRPYDPKWAEFIDGLKTTGRVIFAKELKSGAKTARHTYIGVFDIDGVEVAEGALRFRFVKRIADLA